MSNIVKRLRRWAHTAGCGCTRCIAANEIERLATDGGVMQDALKEIAEGKGAYSEDQLTHAANTIRDMVGLANDALSAVSGRQPDA